MDSRRCGDLVNAYMINENLIENFLELISIALAFVNIDLNDKQINALQKHLHEQDNSFLKKIVEQNEEIIRLGKEIIKLLTNDS